MIGIMLLFSLVGGLLVSAVLGATGVVLHKKALAAGSGGSWPLFWLIAVAVTAIALWLMFSSQLAARAGKAPADIDAAIRMAFLLGTAPGIGLLSGALAIFK